MGRAARTPKGCPGGERPAPPRSVRARQALWSLLLPRGGHRLPRGAPRNGVFQGCDGQDLLARHSGSPVFFPVLAPGTEVTATSHQEGVVGIVFTTGATAELALRNALSAAGEIRVRMKDDDADS
ncbi:hypothetical protein [Streptomyces sp. WM6378]|uniref:hypothetical protein n=1 Tax=Streptomyces sp. WM6378 TaxID=1415557 RepID=UPI00131D932C|nr:hypothetical protein [Streptomyces sp. WM6378]